MLPTSQSIRGSSPEWPLRRIHLHNGFGEKTDPLDAMAQLMHQVEARQHKP